MVGCGHTTRAPLPSAPWEAWLEEILRGAQRDHSVPAEGERLPQSPYPERASSAPALWCPEGPGQDLGLRQILGPPPSKALLGLTKGFGGFREGSFECSGVQRIPSVRPVQASETNWGGVPGESCWGGHGIRVAAA